MRGSEIDASEYNSYYQGYVDFVNNLRLLDAFERGLENTQAFFASLPQAKLHYRYAENKWTPKDILQHIIDTERVFAYRALYFSRANNANLKGFDENEFAQNTVANTRSIDDLLQEYTAVRNASICLFRSFDKERLKLIGTANNSIMSVAAAGFIICGHEIHHQIIIKERYL
ncbi:MULTISPECIES: DinB family protein [Aequorivita]|uniref:DinB family protein n=1 Tax=Aequorivita iocasae TaxID=2803865 RepID=A0ABX7DSH3_9FLAO|nr:MULTISPECIES: DinB family protein [Aequorivita]QQX76104.1 DinB family protein [Aequorivita iocasae]UCA55564.1 DinB family protein [Aequorivita sp. F7]